MSKQSSKSHIYKEKVVTDFRELIDSATNEFGKNTAFTIKNADSTLKDISFIDFKNDISAFGTAILSLGLSSNKIALLAPDCYEWCCSYFAITTSNNIAVPLDFLLPESELSSLIIESQSDAIIFSEKHLSLIKNIINSNCSSLKYCICINFEKNTSSILSFNQILSDGFNLIDSGNTIYRNQKIDKNALSVLIYTSGTTNKPKAVMLSQQNICANVTGLTGIIRHEANDSMLIFLPLHHTLACTASFLYCYYTGFRLYFADSLKDIGKNLIEYKISGMVCVPAVLDIFYRKIIKTIKKSGKYIQFKILCGISNFLMFFGIDFRRKLFKNILDGLGGNLRRIIYGSASTEPEITKFFHTIGINMMQGYGLTEASPVVSAESDLYNSQAFSAGYPLPGETVKIYNPDSTGVGEILVCGNNVMLGYYNNEIATKMTITDNWLHTGDLGKLDKHGRLCITGRIKDVIVLSNGKKVVPEELEALINKLPGISESMVYENFESGNEKICAKIVYSKDYTEFANKSEVFIYNLIDEKIKNLNKTLPLYKYIRDFVITSDPLLKTTSQKIKRNEEIKKISIINV